MAFPLSIMKKKVHPFCTQNEFRALLFYMQDND